MNLFIALLAIFSLSTINAEAQTKVVKKPQATKSQAVNGKRTTVTGRKTNNAKSKKTEEVPVITLQPDSLGTAQTIHGFGASDCWTMKTLGLWPEEKQKQVADWLFSTENDSTGNPKGIGLSIWRFNMGAGSEYQGDDSKIAPGTRTESFLQSDGRYNWNAQEGQRNFLRLAKERGVKSFTLFLNSPNILFTKNHLATNTGRDGTLNLQEDKYMPFVIDIVNVLKGLEQHEGIHFTHVSPLNEPDGHWNWQGPKQEGTPATKKEIAKVVRLLGRMLKQRKMTTEIIAPEASDYRCLYRTHQTDHQRGYELQSFFTPDSTDTYIGNVPNFNGIVAAHSYWTTTPLTDLKAYRDTVRSYVGKYNAHLWQTELCIMGNDTEIGGGNGYDYTMKTALYVARIIHHDLVYANAETWQWWRAAGGDYKDGLLRVIDGKTTDENGEEHTTLTDGTVEQSKLLWALGHYSRFIRPGAKRQNFEVTDTTGLMVSAYRNTDGSMVMVGINYSEKEINVQLPSGQWQAWITTDDKADNMRPIGLVEDKQKMAPRSIITWVRK